MAVYTAYQLELAAFGFGSVIKYGVRATHLSKNSDFFTLSSWPGITLLSWLPQRECKKLEGSCHLQGEFRV